MNETLPYDDEALTRLSQLAQAQQEANRLKASELNILRRKEQVGLDEREATVKLRAEVGAMILALRELSEEIVAGRLALQLISRRIDELTKQQEQIESNMILLLTEHSPERVRQAAEIAETDLSRRRLIRKYRDNLDKLQEQAAEYGPLDVPLKIQNAIEMIKGKIAEIEEQ